VAAKKRDVTLKQVAEEVGMKVDQVRDILREAATVSKAVGDRVFSAARKLGYDLRKLKIGKRMQTRKETLTEVLARVQEQASWGRDEVVAYLKESLALVDRVHKRVFKDEFGG
jgi:DNA-binding LacI/PurR family transcriptional regulator